MLYQQLMDKLIMQEDLTRDDFVHMIAGTISQELTQVQVLGFQMAFFMKGPTSQELADYVYAMRANCYPISTGPVFDITAVDHKTETEALSIATALLTATAGIPTVKQVWEKPSTLTRCTDLLSALKITPAKTESQAKKQLQHAGITFLAPRSFHPVLAQTLNNETEVQIRDLTYSIIGPLSNPADVSHIAFYVHHAETLELLQSVISCMPEIHALLIYMPQTLTVPSSVFFWDGCSWQTLTASDDLFSFQSPDCAADYSQISGLLYGEITDNRRDILLSNTAIALWFNHRADNLQQGFDIAKYQLDSGAAARTLEQLQTLQL